MLETFQTTNELIKRIIPCIEKGKNILIQAGHFPIIFNKKGYLIPAIINDIDDIQLVEFINSTQYIGDFPLTTLEIGLNLGKQLQQKNCDISFAFIVNDWQWLNKGPYQEFILDRADFYTNSELPLVYKNLFEKNKFSTEDIIKSKHYIQDNLFWSEYKLRKAGKKTIKDFSPLSCAMEYLPFLNENNALFDTLISFIPITCQTPILFSSMKFIENNNRQLIHVFYNPVEKNYKLSNLNYGNIV
ncbi:hypothetical protein ACFLTI_08545 [Bacteroidota bacterium]